MKSKAVWPIVGQGKVRWNKQTEGWDEEGWSWRDASKLPKKQDARGPAKSWAT